MPHKLPALPAHCRTLSTVDAARLNASGQGVWTDPSKRCLTCHKALVFRWYAPRSREESSAVEYECECVDQWMLHRWLLNAGIGTGYQRLSWDDAVAVPAHIQERAMAYVVDHEVHVDAGLGLVLWSPDRGTGKTLMATLVAKELMARGEDLYFCQFNDMIDHFTAGWRDEEERRWFNRRVRNAGVLVVDDLGREHKGRSEVTESMLDQVVRHRVAMARPTIITTNYTEKQVREGYGPNVMSLLTECSQWVEVPGTDYRQRHGERILAEKQLGLTRPLVVA